MNSEKRQFLIWIFIAGILFLIVGIHDLIYLSTAQKSGFMIALEFVAGGCFLLNTVLQWRRNNTSYKT